MSRLRGCGLAFRLASPISASISRAADSALPHALRSHSWVCSSSLALSSAQQHGWTAQGWHGSFAVRPISSSAAAAQQQRQQEQQRKSDVRLRQDSEDDAITDQIPLRPMGTVEATSYSVVIIAALGLAVAILWTAGKELLGTPPEQAVFSRALDKLKEDPRITLFLGSPITEQAVFSRALDKLKEDPRITLFLGSPITGFGQPSLNRRARRQIANRTFQDAQGTSHTQVQFFIRGPQGQAQVSCDMYLDASRQWRFSFLLADIEASGRVGTAQRIMVVEPHAAVA